MDGLRFPRGWFVVGFADELARGQSQALSYFGHELVLARGEDGVAHVQGGARTWRVLERNRLVFVHYDPDDAPPRFDIPPLPECEDPGWQPWVGKRLRLATHSREIVENVADRAHFLPVHDTVNECFENEFFGHVAIQRASGRGGTNPDVTFTSEATYYGPGYQITRLATLGLESLLLNAHTMIGANRLDLRFGVMLRASNHSQHFAQAYIEMVQRGFEQDVRIWEHKQWREHPVLCDGDGPIMKLRRWYAQFYAPADKSAAP